MRTRRIAYEPIITVVMSLIEATVAMVENDHSHFRLDSTASPIKQKLNTSYFDLMMSEQ